MTNLATAYSGKLENVYIPGVKEAVDGQKLDILKHIERVNHEIKQENIVMVTEKENSISIDFDEKREMVSLVMEIMDVPSVDSADFCKSLLKLNDLFFHGEFFIKKNKVFFQENLETENLTPDELENNLSAMFYYAKSIKLDCFENCVVSLF